MALILDGSLGLTTPGVVNTAGETIATTLVVSGTTTLTGVTTLTGGLNAALPVLSGGTGVTTKTGTGAVVLGTSPTLTTPTIDSAQVPTISGTAPLYMCRAWVNFNGTGTVAIRGSGNVSSITDNGTGDYTVNFTTAMADANFSVVITNEYSNTRGDVASNHNIYCAAYAASTTTANIQTFASVPTYTDVQTLSVAIFR